MTYTPKDLTGTLFKNEKRQKDSDPQYNGTVFIGGEPYWINLWRNTKEDGRHWLAVKLKPKQAKQGGARDDLAF
jgi:hypothetical protein